MYFYFLAKNLVNFVSQTWKLNSINCHNYHSFSGYLTYGVAAVQVQVNGLTGQVDVLSADLVMDLGTVYILGQ